MLNAWLESIREDEPLPPVEDLPAATVAVGDLFREERPRLLRALARWTNLENAEDAIQQAFLRFIALDRKPGAIDAPYAYLRKATLNVVRDEARRDTRSGKANHIPIEEVAVPGPDQIAVLEARDRLARVEGAVRRLKPLTRDIFVAHRVDGYSYEEIAQRTGLSVRGVEKQMRTAIKQLGRHLRQHG